MNPLDGKVAIITGASAPRGIGRAIAARLAQDGAVSVLTDIDGTVEFDSHSHDRLELLSSHVANILEQGGQASHMALDVTDQTHVLKCVAEVKQRYGRIDILVNNAGSLAGSANFLATTAPQWEASFRVNLLGPMMLAHAVIPEMQAIGGGSIINIGSTGSLGAEPGFGAYTTMKHGLIGFTKTLAAEFGKDGIRCNAICPGYINTDMHAAANMRLSAERNIPVLQVQEERYAQVALRSAGDPADVANAAAYLAGPEGEYVTGIALPVTGGVPFGI